VADSVRLALAQEAAVIAGIQRRAWAEHTDSALSRRLLELADLEQMTRSWEQAVTRPPDARCRVLVAVTDRGVVGFAATTPSPDGDAEPGQDGAVGEFVVDPSARQQGHGSRLLNACADTLRADGFRRATIWVPTGDDGLRRFLVESGWAPDGAHRSLGSDDDDEASLKQVRLHTDLATEQ
jgi:GNAT superfamily N-acetyltransferase